MKAESITGWLGAVGIPPELVSVGTEADNAWCLVRAEDPDETGTIGWEVFWREQGNRYDWARFTNEQVACHYLFGRLTWAQVAGAWTSRRAVRASSTSCKSCAANSRRRWRSPGARRSRTPSRGDWRQRSPGGRRASRESVMLRDRKW